MSVPTPKPSAQGIPNPLCRRAGLSKSISSLLQPLFETEHGVILETLPMSPGIRRAPRGSTDRTSWRAATCRCSLGGRQASTAAAGGAGPQHRTSTGTQRIRTAPCHRRRRCPRRSPGRRRRAAC
ncbi:hypothetical protein GQ55_6G169300 [Panicum hallii var. hallii]|uniref:Uncharacterized protein n=1 Tax=Panicum hallii var. hallii TaxID=1504633 RepID=A0A2T7D6S7_9POAL|nr:hypothetical protein GQ55_6G169300 [Panicum hallii var. hallii]